MDGLRAIAVLMVVIVHACQGAAGAKGLDVAFPANLGARGVDLFFVISGFCLSRPYFLEISQGRPLRIDFGRFMIRRIARIAPPYYAALALFTILAASTFGFPTASGPNVAARGFGELPFDLAFLTTPTPIANASFWTLGVEMRWYVLCPLLIALFVRSRAVFMLVGFVCVVTYGRFPFVAGDFAILPSFMLGIVAAWVSLSRYARTTTTFASIVLVPILMAAVWEQRQHTVVDHADPLWQAASFVAVVASDAPFLNGFLCLAPLVALGRASYSIYLIHEPFVVWLGKSGVPWPIATCASICIGYAFYYCVERIVTSKVNRNRIESTLTLLGRLYPLRALVLRVQRRKRAPS